MIESEKYENYPFWIVFLSNIVSLLIYGLGFSMMIRLGWIVSLVYLIYILILEYRLIRNHCTSCFYWGKTCGFGKGKLSSWFFKKGDISRFCAVKFSWKNMIPDLLVALVPLIAGFVLLIVKFDFLLLVSLLFLIFFSTMGNGFVRGTLTCKYCKQKEIGCPADKLFNKDKQL